MNIQKYRYINICKTILHSYKEYQSNFFQTNSILGENYDENLIYIHKYELFLLKEKKFFSSLAVDAATSGFLLQFLPLPNLGSR